MQPGPHAAHEVVRGRRNGDEVPRDVDAMAQAVFVDRREPSLDVGRVQMA